MNGQSRNRPVQGETSQALEKATIHNLQTGEAIQVMFNPEEYSLDLGNTFAEIGIPGLQTSPIQYVRGNLRTLQMELFFDTYEAGTDVRAETMKVTNLLNKLPSTKAPPILLFSWGSLHFRCVLESAGQRFLMFLSDGTPVRARLTVAFKEYQPIEVEIESGLFVGPPAVHIVMQGDTLSGIAGVRLGDPGAWRDIAELNDIDDPFTLSPGQTLIMSAYRGAKDLYDEAVDLYHEAKQTYRKVKERLE